jgi:lysophosphatidate acyltransferase
MFGVTFSASGTENIDHQNGAIVLLNHQSAVDLGFLAVLWPLLGRAAVVAKRQLMYIFPFGLAVGLWGTIFIDRAKSKEAKNTLDKECDAIANGKKKLLFFPEGTRHQGKTLLPFKKGPFYIAIKTQCPIQPVVCSRYHFLDSKTYRFSPGESEGLSKTETCL